MCFNRASNVVSSSSTKDFLDSPQFGAPKVLHIVEALVDGVEPPIDAFVRAVESAIHVRPQKPNERSVKEHRNAD
jgi:hypothetical protein